MEGSNELKHFMEMTVMKYKCGLAALTSFTVMHMIMRVQGVLINVIVISVIIYIQDLF